MIENQPKDSGLINLSNAKIEAYSKKNLAGEPVSQDQQVDDSELKANMKKRNIALAIVGIIGLAIVVLGFFQMRNVLQIPFGGLDESKDAKIAAVLETEEVDLQDEDPELLKTQDTDGDGLTDYEEIYTYNTSSYLTDSDSDGIDDLEELKKGQDPNCPVGRDCFKSTSTTVETVENPNLSEEELDVTPAELRSLLLQSGQYTKEQIDQVDDETLMEIYRETLQETPELKSEEINKPESVDQAVGQMQEVSIEEIKQMLIDQGIAVETINQIDDASLRQLYDEALSTAQEAYSQE